MSFLIDVEKFNKINLEKETFTLAHDLIILSIDVRMQREQKLKPMGHTMFTVSKQKDEYWSSIQFLCFIPSKTGGYHIHLRWVFLPQSNCFGNALTDKIPTGLPPM